MWPHYSVIDTFCVIYSMILSRSLLYCPILPILPDFDKRLNLRVWYSVLGSLNTSKLFGLLLRVAQQPVTIKYLIIFTTRKVNPISRLILSKFASSSWISWHLCQQVVKFWHSDFPLYILPSNWISIYSGGKKKSLTLLSNTEFNWRLTLQGLFLLPGLFCGFSFY